MASSRPGAFRATRIIVTALAGGVLLFWIVGWVLTEGGAEGLQPDVLPDSFALIVWAAVALPAFGGALYFRGRAASAAERTAGTGGTSRTDGAAGTGAVADTEGAAASPGTQAQTHTIVAHALLEGPALLGGSLFILLGTTPVVWVALPVYLLGLVLTWPSADWFGPARV